MLSRESRTAEYPSDNSTPTIAIDLSGDISIQPGMPSDEYEKPLSRDSSLILHRLTILLTSANIINESFTDLTSLTPISISACFSLLSQSETGIAVIEGVFAQALSW